VRVRIWKILLGVLACSVSTFANNYSSWAYSGNIVINPTALSLTAPVTNFPVLVRLSSATFNFSQSLSSVSTVPFSTVYTGPGGADIRFTASDGVTPLYYQIARWNGVGDTADFWVSVPSISNTTPTTIKMFWGMSGQTLDTTVESPTKVFSRSNVASSGCEISRSLGSGALTPCGFVAVFHMGIPSTTSSGGNFTSMEATSTTLDTTGNGATSKNYTLGLENKSASNLTNPVVVDSGVVGDAELFTKTSFQSLSINGSKSDSADNFTLKNFTLSGWVYQVGGVDTARIISKSGQYHLGLNNSGQAEFEYDNNPNDIVTSAGSTPDTAQILTASLSPGWNYLVGVHTSSGTMGLSVNGSALTLSTPTRGTPFQHKSTSTVSVGYESGDGGITGTTGTSGPDMYLNGLIGEPRLENVARNGDWVALNYATQKLSAAADTLYAAPVIVYNTPSISGVKNTAIASDAVTSSGGTVTSYVMKSSTPLPAGLSLNASSGTISGTPTAITASKVDTVIAMGQGGTTDSIAVTIAVADTSPAFNYKRGSISGTKNVAITSDTVVVSGTGGITGYAMSPSTPLPAGLTLNTSNGIISGTPTAVVASGADTVIATGPSGTGRTTVTIAVQDTAPNISLKHGSISAVKNVAITPDTVVSTGGGITSYAMASSTPLPTGLTLNTSTGIISGAPTAVSTSTVDTVIATGSGGTGAATVSIAVQDTVPAISLKHATVSAVKNIAITPDTVVVTGTGGITGYAMSTFTPLPTGLTLNTSTGIISGTPTAVTASGVDTVIATGPGGTGRATVTIAVVDTSPAFVYLRSSISGIRKVSILADTVSVTGTGGITGYAMAPSTPLPAGLTLGSSTGIISGTPTVVSGSATDTIIATGPGGTGRATVTIAVVDTAPSIAYRTNPATYAKSVAIIPDSVLSTGGGITGFAVNPALPTGLTLNPTTGIVSGTPTALTVSAADTVTATGPGGTGKVVLVITVSDTAPAFSYRHASISGVRNVSIAVDTTVSTGGGITSYAMASSTPLPAGLNLNPLTGFISGVPTAVSSLSTDTIIATGPGGTGHAIVTVMVADTSPAFSYARTSIPGVKNVAILPDTVVVTGTGAITSYAVSSSTPLPPGLSLNISTGIISGTPTSTFASAADTIIATGPGGIGKSVLTLAVADTSPAFSYVRTSISGTRNSAILSDTVVVKGTGAITGYAMASSTPLPAGLTLNSSTGIVSGTPTVVVAPAVDTVIATGPGGTGRTLLTLAIQDIAPIVAFKQGSISAVKNVAIVPDTLVSTGGGVTSFSVAASTPLPTGLSLNTSTGILSGTPTGVSASAIDTIIATGSGGSSSTVVTIAVQDTAPAFAYKHASISAVKNVAILPDTAVATGTGSITSYTMAPSTPLPAGFTLNTSTGILSGTPTVISGSTVDTIIATGPGGTGRTVVTVAVADMSPQISYARSSISAVKNVAITPDTVVVTGTGAITSYAMASSTPLPAGLSLNTSSGILSGTPTATSTSTTDTLIATGPGGTGRTTLTLAVADTSPAFSYKNVNITGYKNIVITSDTVAVTGTGAITSYAMAASTPLPAGLTLNTSNGIISGTPLVTYATTIDTVIATGPGGTGKATVTITVTPGQEDYTQWSNQVSIPINTSASGANTSANETKFPMLVRLTSSNFSAFSTPGTEASLRFARGTTQLKYQVDHFDSTGGQNAQIWVSVDTVFANNASQSFTMYWGKSGAPDSSNGTEVFDTTANGYKFVSHLNNTTPTDATVKNWPLAQNGTGTGLPVDTTGVIGGALSFLPGGITAFDGAFIGQGSNTNAGSYTLSSSTALDLPAGSNYTVSAWANAHAGVGTVAAGMIFCESSRLILADTLSGSNYVWELGEYVNGVGKEKVDVNLTPGTWHHLVGVRNGSAMTLYVDGVPSSNVVTETANLTVTPKSAGIGRDNHALASADYAPSASNGMYFSGAIDEVQFSNVARDSNWVKLSYYTQSLNGTAPVISYSPSSVTDTVGKAASHAVSLSGGNVTGYAVTSGTLPSGLSLNTSTGLISGTPTTAVSTVTVTVTGTGPGGTSAANLTLTIVQGPPIVSYKQASILGIKNVAIISDSALSTGGTVTSFAMASSTPLPTGLTLSSSTGLISGTPTSVSVSAVDTIIATGTGGTGRATVTIAVGDTAPSLAYKRSSIAAVKNVTVLPDTVVLTGTGAITSYAMASSTPLPSGLTLSTSTGIISGTPAAVSVSAVDTVIATGPGGTGRTTVTVVVADTAPRIAYRTNPATYGKNVAIVPDSVISTGGAITGYTVNPALPVGLTLNATTGVISGTPTAPTVTAGDTVNATGPGGIGKVILTLTVSDTAPAISYRHASISAIKNVGITPDSVVSMGGAVTGYAMASSTPLPAGLILSSSTGLISGIPTTVSVSATDTIIATGTSGTGRTVVTIAVSDTAPAISFKRASITAVKNMAIIPDTAVATGTGAITGYTMSTSTPLPLGLILNPSTGILSGTPTAVSASATDTVLATGPGGTAKAVVMISVTDTVPVISYKRASISAVKNVAILPDTVVTGTGAITGYTVSPALPAGLSLNASTGLITGTPLAAVSATDTVTATGPGGTAKAVVTIVVADPTPVITAQPVALTKVSGQSASFTVVATGLGSLGYQWTKNGVNINGATSATYTIASVASTDTGTYAVVLTDTISGTVTSLASSGVYLTVTSPPVITSQLVSKTANVGTAVKFGVTVTGTMPLHYVWLHSHGTVTDTLRKDTLLALTDTLTLPSVALTDTGSYKCSVANTVSAVLSNAATLAVSVPPAIVSQPASQSFNVNGNVRFGVVVTGTSPLIYTWIHHHGTASDTLKKDTLLVLTDTLVLTNAPSSDTGSYVVIVSNAGGNVVSNAASLQVPLSILQSELRTLAIRTMGSSVLFNLPQGIASGRVSIIDPWGRVIWDRSLSQSAPQTTWNGTAGAGAASPGIYFVRMQMWDAGKKSAGVLEKRITYVP